jgi:hypothetical protein
MKRSITILFTLLLMLAAFSVASAGKFSYLSGIQVQNLAAVDANVQLSYYNQDGTLDGSAVDDIIPANGSVTYFPVDATDGFDGSVVISADQPVAAISNILGDLGAAAASYVGSGAGSTSVNLPLLFQDNAGFDTWFNVQNTGTADATVDVAYSDGTVVADVVIAPGAAHTFDQATETHSAAVFSGVVSSDQPVAVAVIQESVDVMFAYTGFTTGTPNPVLPLINANNGGYITGVQIQNTGATPTDVTVSYTASTAGTDCTETLTIPANDSTTFALLAFSGTNTGETCANAPTKFVGSAEVTGNTANNDLVAIVNQLLIGVNGGTYGSFDAAAATSTVVLPLIMDRNSGYYTGFNVQNVGAAETTVTCTFTNSTHEEVATLSPGEAMNALQFEAIADAYVGSATCNADASGSIIGVVNELGPSSTADQLLVYEAVNN